MKKVDEAMKTYEIHGKNTTKKAAEPWKSLEIQSKASPAAPEELVQGFRQLLPLAARH